MGAPAWAQSIQTDQAVYDVGERVVVTFTGCPGSGTDWVGIYPASQQQHQGSTYWRYCQGGMTPAGSGPTSGTLTFLPMSLPPGQWQARLFFNDGYTLRAVTNFEILSSAAAPTPAPPAESTLTVMSFNIWVSAANVPDGVVHAAEAIRETGADIIGLQECNQAALDQIVTLLREDEEYANAEAVGNGAQCVISRYGFERTYSAGVRGIGAKIRLASGDAVRFFSCHLTAYPYGPYSIRDGRGVEAALADEKATRLEDLNRVMALLTERAEYEPDLTTFIVGDFNCPSHLDWTEANRSQNFGEVVEWPVTVRLAGAGYFDAYRRAFPDPVTDRGLTWTPGAPRDSLDRTDVHDRIDMIHVRPHPSVEAVVLQAYTLDREPWPSDHRAVVASLRLVPACPADFNHDGEVNSQDFFDFIAEFFRGCP